MNALDPKAFARNLTAELAKEAGDAAEALASPETAKSLERLGAKIARAAEGNERYRKHLAAQLRLDKFHVVAQGYLSAVAFRRKVTQVLLAFAAEAASAAMAAGLKAIAGMFGPADEGLGLPF